MNAARRPLFLRPVGLLAAPVVLLLGWGCSPLDDLAGIGSSPQDQACEQMLSGAAMVLTASGNAQGRGDEPPPEITALNQRFEVILYGAYNGSHGWVTFAPTEAGQYIFSLDVHAPLRLESEGIGYALQTLDNVGRCEQLGISHGATLEARVYQLRIGPANFDTVALVAEKL